MPREPPLINRVLPWSDMRIPQEFWCGHETRAVIQSYREKSGRRRSKNAANASRASGDCSRARNSSPSRSMRDSIALKFDRAS